MTWKHTPAMAGEKCIVDKVLLSGAWVGIARAVQDRAQQAGAFRGERFQVRGFIKQSASR